jgi:hypothetical protein
MTTAKPAKPMRAPLKLFFCYAREDAAWRRRLDEHLELVRREGLITTWYDQRIAPGTEWSEVIQQHLSAADLVVFLVSPAFLASEYISTVEMKLALRLHRKGAARVVPVMLEKVESFDTVDLFALQALPACEDDVLPIKSWPDPVRALDAVADGIRRAAHDFIVESGGAYEPGAHAFGEAELAGLDERFRKRALAGLRRLRSKLVDAVPRRQRERNLLVATWALNRFGQRPVLPESLYYLAQVISAFDVVALQEIGRAMETLDRLLAILGPEWRYFVTDISGAGSAGNVERFAILYYHPRVAFRNISGEVVLPQDLLIDGHQLALKPLLSVFRRGRLSFRLCTTHITFGGGRQQISLRECEALARYLGRVASYGSETIVLAGNFNIRRPDSLAVDAFRAEGFSIPPETIHPSTFTGRHYSSLIGLLDHNKTEGKRMRVFASGAFNPLHCVYREEDEELYSEEDLLYGRSVTQGARAPRYGRVWRTMQLSDHVPVWVELVTPPEGGLRKMDSAGNGEG